MQIPPKKSISSFQSTESLELAGEVTHQFGFPSDFQATLDGVAAVVDVLQRGCDDIHVVVGVHTARDAETHEVVATEAVLAGDRVTVGKHVTDFAGTDASFEIQFAGPEIRTSARSHRPF